MYYSHLYSPKKSKKPADTRTWHNYRQLQILITSYLFAFSKKTKIKFFFANYPIYKHVDNKNKTREYLLKLFIRDYSCNQNSNTLHSCFTEDNKFTTAWFVLQNVIKNITNHLQLWFACFQRIRLPDSWLHLTTHPTLMHDKDRCIMLSQRKCKYNIYISILNEIPNIYSIK